MNKVSEMAIVIFGSTAVLLYFAFQNGSVQLDYSGLVNGTLQGMISGILLVPVTILLYRYRYHRKSKK
jgi:hypothetical protein